MSDVDKVDWVTMAGAGVFYAIVLLTGFIAAKVVMSRGSKNSTDTAANQVMVGYRDFGWIVSIATITASWVGATAICAGAERTYTHGVLPGMVPSFSMALSLLFGGIIIAKKMRTANYVTIVDPFQIKYGKKVGVIFVVSAFVGEVFCCGATLSALGTTLSVVANIDHTISIIVSGFVAVSYTIFGGIFSVAYTDIVQLVFVTIGTILAIPFIATNDAIQPLNTTDLMMGTSAGSKTTTITAEVDSFLLIAFGSFCWQCYCQRILASRTVRIAVVASSISCFVAMALSIPAIVIGGIAKSIGKYKEVKLLIFSPKLFG